MASRKKPLVILAGVLFVVVVLLVIIARRSQERSEAQGMQILLQRMSEGKFGGKK